MIKCGKCNAEPNEKDIIGWKCNSCGKAFKVSKSKLHSILMKKAENPEKFYINCPSCKNSLDDGNECIVWKCSCGNTNIGKLKDFKEEVEAEQDIFANQFKSNILPDDFMDRIIKIFIYQMERQHRDKIKWKVVHRILNKMI